MQTGALKLSRIIASLANLMAILAYLAMLIGIQKDVYGGRAA